MPRTSYVGVSTTTPHRAAFKIVARLRGILERFLNAVGCMGACFVADETLENLPLPSQVGRTKVGGIDFNKPRMRRVAEAVLALSPSPAGFTASDLAQKVREMSGQAESEYGPRHAAYDIRKLRAKGMVQTSAFACATSSLTWGWLPEDRQSFFHPCG